MVCIDPIGNRCAKNMQFLALYEARGLGAGVDGILGLSNHHDAEKASLNFVKSLKQSGVIEEAIVSFSVQAEKSYALFGEMNATQVVGQLQGLHSFKTYGYLPDFMASKKNWALEGLNVLYGSKQLKELKDLKSFPAIIDTGSSTIGLTPQLFDSLRNEWQTSLNRTLDCTTNDDFC